MPGPDGDPLGVLALRLHRAFEEMFFSRMARIGYNDLRMRHTRLLEVIREGGVRSSVLADRLGMTKQATGEVVDALEAADYIQRVPDPSDKRAKLVELSAKGHRAFEDAFVILDALEQRFEQLLGAGRYASVRAAMWEVIAELESLRHPE